MAAMTTRPTPGSPARATGGRPADPLQATDWLLVDGNNLLHALSASKTPAPRSALIGRLRGAVPSSIAIDVVFDGPASPGLAGERIAPGLRVRYGGRRSADAVLLSMVEEIRATDGPAATAAILAVTDDSQLRHHLRTTGARTAGTSWPRGPPACRTRAS
jgi:predicted RNA-binding protein with PIN domain